VSDETSVERALASWRYVGVERPAFAMPPGPGQESVWDYPRPPRIAPDAREIVVRAGALLVARSRRALRVLETASPPTFYLPPDDVDLSLLEADSGSSSCEWKGRARYFAVRLGTEVLRSAAWTYRAPRPAYAALRDHLAFYPALLECYVGGERARPQPGGFYGGWITSELTGPFKGEPGSRGW